MDMKTSAALAAFALLAFVGIAFAAPAWQNAGIGRGMMNAAHMNTTEQAQFETAVESGDYTAALALHEQYGFGGRMMDSLDASSFAKFSDMHKAMDAGDYEKAQQIRSELRSESGVGAGLGMGSSKQAGNGRGMGRGTGMRGNCAYASND